ncbi:MAG: hypothetical protein P4N59_17460 [Negativicutes bacterium]|nr:hypothetical protein [Negativicutes bacterium]
MFWIENVPLNGTTEISVQATDASGRNTATKTLTIVPSTVQLTIDSTPTGDNLYDAVGTVSGTVGDVNATVAVNGVEATDYFPNGDGTATWTANNVPIYGIGTASFDAVAYSGSGGNAGLAVRALTAPGATPEANASTSLEMPAKLIISRYAFGQNVDYDIMWGGNGDWDRQHVMVKTFNASLSPGQSGQWEQHYRGTYFESWYDSYWLGANTPASGSWSENGVSGTVNDTSIPQWDPINNGNFIVAHYMADGVHFEQHKSYNDGSSHSLLTDNVNAVTAYKLYTGGKSGVNRQSLFCIYTGSDSVGNFTPNIDDANFDYPWQHAAIGPVDLASIECLGKRFGADGLLWIMLPDNASPTATAITPGKKHYAVDMGQQKYAVTLASSGDCKSYDDLSVVTPTFCVGQALVFFPKWTPSAPPYDPDHSFFHWHLPENFVNESYSYSSSCTSYRRNSDLLEKPSTQCWYVRDPGGACSIGMNLKFANGQIVNIAREGNFVIYRPEISAFHKIDNGFTATRTTLNGIMEWDATIDSDFPGSIGVTQIINCNNWQSTYYTGGLNLIDGASEIYGEPDDNGQPKPYDPNDIRTQSTLLGDQPWCPMAPCANMMNVNFKDYIRFCPNCEGIFVTLATVDWHMSGDACLSGPILPNDFPPASDPVDSDAFPKWEWHY